MKVPLQELKRHGYWLLRILPLPYSEHRIASYGDLSPLIEKVHIDKGGYEFPYLRNGSGVRHSATWIEGDTDRGDLLQSWRLYQSGQFAVYESLSDDRRDKGFGEPRRGWAPRSEFSISDALYQCWISLEIARRFALEPTLGPLLRIELSVVGLKGRALRWDIRNRSGFIQAPTTEATEYRWADELSASQLSANSASIAVHVAKEILARFGWSREESFIQTLMRESGAPIP